jgi:hypothetical protein
VVYGSSRIVNQGWQTRGGGGVATKAAFNLLGGSVEFDIDLSNTNVGVNANIYTISPTFSDPSSSFSQSDYCDGQKTGNKWCAEIDWIESNGKCGGATTYHTHPGTGGGCSAWGCFGTFSYGSNTAFHVRVDIDTSGAVTVTRDGQVVSINQNGVPDGSDWSVIAGQYASQGAVIYSSQWVGWVPMGDQCGSSSGNLGSSSFSVSNLKVTGSVVQGPTPNAC